MCYSVVKKNIELLETVSENDLMSSVETWHNKKKLYKAKKLTS